MTTFLAFAFIAISLLIVLVVLVQRGRGGGLAGAFGSGGGSSSAFGTKTGDVFTTFTVVLFVVFMLLAIWLNFRFRDYKSDLKGATHAEAAAADASTPTGAAPAQNPVTTPPTPAITTPVTSAPATTHALAPTTTSQPK